MNRSITSNGGPYVGLPVAQLAHFQGFEDQTLHEEIFKTATDEGGVAELSIGSALLLGTPDTLFWFPEKKGGVLVRIVSFDVDDDEELSKLIVQLDDEDWIPAGEIEAIEPWFVFDAALCGEDAQGEGLELDLSGSYRVHTRELLGDGLELLLVRLKKVIDED